MWFTEDIGIDLGTASVLVFKKGRGVVLNEPSVVAIDNNSNKVIAVGEEARQMLGRTPGHIVAIRPLKEGVIADYDTTEKMLSYFIRRIMGRKFFFKPRVVACIPTGATDVEERAVRQATLSSGARQAFIIEEPVAAALGAGIDISEATGNMVVDIGGGTSDIAVLSLGGIVCNSSLRVGGDKFDEAIIRYIRKEYNLMIGDRTAEEVKFRVGTAFVNEGNRKRLIEVRGRDLVSGLPKTIKFGAEDCWVALQEPIATVIEGVKKVLEVTPPELAADIVNNGIVMTGGGSLLDGLDTLLSKETNLPVHIADDAISCVAIGTGRVLNEISVLANSKGKGSRRVL
ncbi:MAG: rod shape-determining protein [Syntrophomonas sp.]|uniref:rod shape-determining protein n=1 Tax=Syntrophomonas sp. TaxID=2053627 RepID=UPI0026191F77|nr:rod shape-determining protein [Syntrophomonas sp.]MDD2509550.1 rod shape-determining protein [Syntrophomonas sp.]MDD3878421.1 rod shape-determining protein [Syntrophomonas sp.]MDD4625480.1 rod shape-determining protein [Syntrophomonas sp.]